MTVGNAKSPVLAGVLAVLAIAGPGGRAAGADGSSKVYTSWPFNAAEAKKRQAETAGALKAEVVKTLDLGEGVKMELVLIPAGEFVMGCKLPPAEAKKRFGEVPRVVYEDQRPRHRVRITRPFYMGKCEVTVGQFARFAAESGYKTTVERAGKASDPHGKRKDHQSLVAGLCWKNPGFKQGPEHPVAHMSYYDAREFCKWLSKKTGKDVTLATEAEWEYACRAGTDTAFWFGDDPADGKGKLNWCDTATEKLFEKSKAEVD